MQKLQDSVERAKSAKARKAKSHGERMEAASAAQGELDETTAMRNADKTYLEDTIASCKVKSEDYEQRQKLRAEERVALDKAIEILSGSAVAGAASKHLPALSQTSVSFGLLRSTAYSPMQSQAAEYLQMRAERCQSRMLSELATKVLEDPFTKVKKMIKDLIVRLMEEATAETDHKGWCDKELGTNKIARESKAEDVDPSQLRSTSSKQRLQSSPKMSLTSLQPSRSLTSLSQTQQRCALLKSRKTKPL